MNKNFGHIQEVNPWNYISDVALSDFDKGNKVWKNHITNCRCFSFCKVQNEYLFQCKIGACDPVNIKYVHKITTEYILTSKKYGTM